MLAPVSLISFGAALMAWYLAGLPSLGGILSRGAALAAPRFLLAWERLLALLVASGSPLAAAFALGLAASLLLWAAARACCIVCHAALRPRAQRLRALAYDPPSPRAAPPCRVAPCALSCPTCVL